MLLDISTIDFTVMKNYETIWLLKINVIILNNIKISWIFTVYFHTYSFFACGNRKANTIVKINNFIFALFCPFVVYERVWNCSEMIVSL